MTEADAQNWIEQQYGTAVRDRLLRLAELIVVESQRQNLVARSGLETLWARHFVDSAQLARLAPPTSTTWLDIGTGAGFPGMVIALLGQHRVTIAEPRRKRVDFLTHVAAECAVQPVALRAKRVEAMNEPPFDVISARAVAATHVLLANSSHLRTLQTRYLLPRGRTAATELECLREDWQGMFHVEQSLTDPDSGIIVADHVAAR